MLEKELRNFARGQQCTLRLHDDNGNRICNGDPATTVLAHIRLRCMGGTGAKPNDLIGAHSCSSCHDAIDGRGRFRISTIDADKLGALCETLDRVMREYRLVRR